MSTPRDDTMAALGLLMAEAMLEGEQETEGWAWATIPHTSLEDAAAATERRMRAQEVVNLARGACGPLVPEEEQ